MVKEVAYLLINIKFSLGSGKISKLPNYYGIAICLHIIIAKKYSKKKKKENSGDFSIICMLGWLILISLLAKDLEMEVLSVLILHYSMFVVYVLSHKRKIVRPEHADKSSSSDHIYFL